MTVHLPRLKTYIYENSFLHKAGNVWTDFVKDSPKLDIHVFEYNYHIHNSSTDAWMDSVNNASKSGHRNWKHIFGMYKGCVKELPRRK